MNKLETKKKNPILPLEVLEQSKSMRAGACAFESSRLRMISWQAKEFRKKNKGPLWYFIWFLFVLGLVIFAILQKSPLMVLCFVLIGAVAYLFSQQEPKKINFLINKKGVKIGKKLYPFDELESFWIFYDPPRKKILSLKNKKTFFPYLTIPLSKTNPLKIRKYLLKFLPEKEHEESIIEDIAEKFGF
jgi:hypothetical protein